MSVSMSKKRGIWYLWIYENGKTRGISLGTRNKKIANQLAKKLLNNPETSLNKTITLSDLFSLWKNWNIQFSSKYLEMCELLWNLFIKHVGNSDITTITQVDIINYLRYLKRERFSDTYIHIRMKTVRAIFNWAVAQGYLEESPFTSKIKLPKPRNRIEFLSQGEIELLLKAAEDCPLYQAYLEFLLATGCRRGELHQLKWSHINSHFIEFFGKTGHRTFPMQPHIKKILQKIKQHTPKENEYVYVIKETGEHPKLEETIGRMVKRYIRKAGLKDSYTTHTLRHTFASHLVLKGVSIYTVAKLLGHSSVKTTERYGHLAPERINTNINYLQK